ncbi:MAG: Selenide, water dikinase [Dehalococcoidia bacterium]|nr:Selenide, water dikinase [Dehalococcoidia bacterium]
MLRQLPAFESPDLLVGTETGDDAAVYRVSGDLALVLTVDFFPPIVDDPWHFGAIAAANSFSDVYAMGGRPILALNMVCFPVGLSLDILGEILKGAAAKAQEAGVLIVGGHTIDDQDPKYGMAVTGFIEPGRQVTNASARVGDRLVLTKPLGTGIITTAGKAGVAEPAILSRAIQVMSALNRASSEAMMEVGVNACTDVTGFGFLGHLRGMVEASGVGARVHFSRVPLIEGTWELVERGIAPGGTRRNLESVDKVAWWDPSISQEAKLVLCDAQTSGGLLMSVSSEKLPQLMKALSQRGVREAVIVGEIVERGASEIEVLP